MSPQDLRNVLEAAMLAAGRALGVDDFLALFEGSPDAPDRASLRTALDELAASLEGRALELVEVASGYRLQVRREYSPWLAGLFAERPPRYSRALLETLALIAYRQPITRGEIEDVRGVAVSSNIMKTLLEREWIRVLGHREVPGRPALYGTTRGFLDHFGLKGLDGLPPLAEVRDLDQVEPDLFAAVPAGADQDPAAAPGGDGGPDEPGGDEDASPAHEDIGGWQADADAPGARGAGDGEDFEADDDEGPAADGGAAADDGQAEDEDAIGAGEPDGRAASAGGPGHAGGEGSGARDDEGPSADGGAAADDGPSEDEDAMGAQEPDGRAASEGGAEPAGDGAPDATADQGDEDVAGAPARAHDPGPS